MGRMSYPQRSENDKILVYVNRFKENGDAEAFQEIVKALHGFMQHLSLKKFFFVPGNNSEDIYQEGLIALANKAIPDYDEEKGPFLGFAKLCIRRHIITILKSANNNRNKPLNMAMSLDATVCDDEDDGPIPISEFLPPKRKEDILKLLLRAESHGRLKKSLFSKLTLLESRVLELYLQSMSYAEIVMHMNKRRRGKTRVNTKAIDNALCRAKKKSIELLEETKLDIQE